MWGEPDPDPGDGPPGSRGSSEMKDLKDQNEQQQVLIAQLKEMLRKEQSTVPQEKVEEYINTLSKAKAKKSRSKRDDSGATEKSGSSMDSKKHEKVNLLKQQMEENKAKLAERGMRQKDLEEMVTVIKAQLNDSQQLINPVSVSAAKNLNYNKNTSPEELYNILLVKEKKITDLFEKNQKNEATILDLEENLREKDSVIDARTRAITLMTENLSKKGKDTLDALDDTKEQMRKMQENFVTLESEMKARQMVLLNDLKTKNIEIADLQVENQKLKEEKSAVIDRPESENHEVIIKDLKLKLDESRKTIEEYESTVKELKNEETGDQKRESEIEKLRKQLDESNKNMIKVKAQNKSKIKELNKKLDGFKKMSDANATIVQLQNEITKLNEKIAELEEEKGNMQLKMVESIESIKGSTHSDDVRELQEKLERNLEELDDKDKVINLLESDIISLNSEINALNEKISGLSRERTEQVTSELKSVQIEEQLENVESSNRELRNEIEILKKEKEELIGKIEEFVKEKLELTTKLDNYVQENMELIDKLEKLSAEKVSSAESIEIVESLTQQEKLELAAYQQNMDTNLEDPIKHQDEEPPATELNESVLQLTEETAELLKKIEMFNMERKEVMAKLEALKEENNKLGLKLNEVENNRDILAETYEQVQTEKDQLVKENEELLEKLKIPQENDEMEAKLEEISNYRAIIDENRTELINSSNTIDHLRTELSRKENELEESNDLINDLNKIVDDLQQSNSKLGDDFETTQKQLEELKSSLIQTEEFEKIHEEEIEEKNRRIEELSQELAQKEETVKNIEEMKKKYLELQERLNTNDGSLEKQVEELSNKNKEQLEKMKKIAANLKKKTQAYQELEGKYQELEGKYQKVEGEYRELEGKCQKIRGKCQEIEGRYQEEKEKWETEANEKEKHEENLKRELEDLKREVEDLKREIDSKSSILEQSELRIEELSLTIMNLEEQSRQKREKIETNLKQELSTSLHEEFDDLHGNSASTNEDKLKELQLIVETNEMDLAHYKERSQKLEEDLSAILEEKENLMAKTVRLEDELDRLAKISEEKTLLEVELGEVEKNSEMLLKRNEELSEENGELSVKTREEEELIAKLKIKLKKTQEKMAQLKMAQSALEEQERENEELKRKMVQLESILEQTRAEHEESRKRNRIDYEKIESDYQSQLEDLVKSRNDLTIDCEKLRESVKFTEERGEELALELDEKNRKLETEIETLRAQLVFETAKRAVENVISVAEDKIIDTKDTQTEEIEIAPSQVGKIEDENFKVTKEELEKKIKALEMLLFNVDREKNEVVEECSEMLNELTRLVYEKVQRFRDPETYPAEPPMDDSTPQIASPMSDLKSQIVSPMSDLESQIVSASDIETLSDPAKLRQLEFEGCDPLLGQQNRPVVEKLSQPSKAYLTYQMGENDDGWGWGAEEARLEEEHQLRTENDPQVRALKSEVEDLKQKLEQQQGKYAKLVKKCKELKHKNDQLEAKVKSDSSDLDQAIQEELKTQIIALETKIKEASTELEKEKREKLNTLKRIDVLTAANEKMLEMKEIQDSEVYRWKRKCEEIQQKLDHLDWDDDEAKSPKIREETAKNQSEDIEELKKLVQDLTVDNEELQALLNDQKQQRVRLERSKSLSNEERIKNLEEDVSNRDALIHGLAEDKDKITGELKEKVEQLRNEEKMTGELEDELKRTQEEFVKVRTELEELRAELEGKRNESMDNSRLEELERLLTEKTLLADQFRQSNESLNREISSLGYELEILKREFDNTANQRTQSIEDVNPSIQERTQFRANNVKELLEIFDNFESLRTNYDQISNAYEEKMKELEEELLKQKQQYQYLQELTSRNILDLQTELEEQKQKNDQLQVENVYKLKELSEELEKEQQNCSDKNRLGDLLEGKETEMKKLEESVEELKKNLNEKQIELRELLEEKETNIKELEGVVEIFQNNKSGLGAEIDQLKAELEEQKQKNDQLQKITEELEEKYSDKNQLEEKETNTKKLEELVEELKRNLNEKQIELGELENKLVETVAELEAKWAVLVDERGDTVAESWKSHLALVESDYEATRAKLQTEINELEEKCNALVNENNELRKNVDAEIKNEVDRISALQQQITDRQQAVNELKRMLELEQMEKADLVQRASQIDSFQQLLDDKEVELANLKTLAETTRQQCEEKREVVEEVVKMLEKNASYPLSCEKLDILEEIQRQLGLSTDKNREVDGLKSELSIVKAELQNLTEQLRNYSVAVEERDAQIAGLKDSQIAANSYGERIKELEEELQNQKQQSLEKLEEIGVLNNNMEQLKTQLISTHQEFENLQRIHAESNYALEDYKQKLEEYRQMQIALEEKDRQIAALNRQLQQSVDNKETEKLETELAQSKDSYALLHQSLGECQQRLFDSTQDLATKTHECETLTQQLEYWQRNAEILQIEMNQSNETLQLKEQEFAASLENIEKTRRKELENHYEELLEAKDLDLQTLKAQVAESVHENSRIKSELEERIAQLEMQLSEISDAKSELERKILELEAKLLEQNKLEEEENNQLSEMRGIIEEQVVKIEELKKELFEKSNDYDGLIAEMDIGRNAITQQPVASGSRTEDPSAVAEEQRPQIPEDDLSEPVNRAELDLALYMLHQRDVRCEELTVELTQLLEERDTLQLRLSNAIREKEEFRSKFTGTSLPQEVPSTSAAEAAPGTPKSSRTSEIFLAASGTELASEPTEDLTVRHDLASKLSELRTVGYKKDKTFVDERDQRRMQQFSFMQQHIKEAAKLPPEAAAKLVDASYTLSRDVQSPSKVLLNWFWGRSTPRVNDT